MSRHRKPIPIPAPVAPYTNTFGNLNDCILSNWGAPMGGTFALDHVAIVEGMLRLKLTQLPSVGGEIQLKQLFGYGTYEWDARMGTTSPTPYGVGLPKTGGVSGLFNFINNSETEIDFEHEGQFPDFIDLTTWQGLSLKQTDQINVLLGPTHGFHKYKFRWAPGKIDFYIDGGWIRSHTLNVPVTPAYVLCNHWGTEVTAFGGVATPGVDRYLYVRRFSFTPLT